MSGGSLDYACYKIDSIIDSIKDRSKKPLHLAFCKHLEKVAKALHDLEWMFSGDTDDGDEKKSIMEVITKNDLIDEAINQAKEINETLKNIIEKAEEVKE